MEKRKAMADKWPHGREEALERKKPKASEKTNSGSGQHLEETDKRVKNKEKLRLSDLELRKVGRPSQTRACVQLIQAALGVRVGVRSGNSEKERYSFFREKKLFLLSLYRGLG